MHKMTVKDLIKCLNLFIAMYAFAIILLFYAYIDGGEQALWLINALNMAMLVMSTLMLFSKNYLRSLQMEKQAKGKAESGRMAIFLLSLTLVAIRMFDFGITLAVAAAYFAVYIACRSILIAMKKIIACNI